jgi:hypothetical protein
MTALAPPFVAPFTAATRSFSWVIKVDVFLGAEVLCALGFGGTTVDGENFYTHDAGELDAKTSESPAGSEEDNGIAGLGARYFEGFVCCNTTALIVSHIRSSGYHEGSGDERIDAFGDGGNIIAGPIAYSWKVPFL